MDHVRKPGTEPLSATLSQIKQLKKLKGHSPKVSKLKPNGWCNKPTISLHFKH